MADEELNDEVESEEESGSESSISAGASKLVKMLLYIVGGLLLIFLIIGISFLVSRYVQERAFEREQDIVVAPPPPPLASYSLPDFSITTRDAEPHFAKISISLAYEDSAELNTELIQRTVQIQHLINTLLRGKRYEDLNSVEATVTLAEEIKAHINVILISGKIKEVYFREFVVN